MARNKIDSKCIRCWQWQVAIKRSWYPGESYTFIYCICNSTVNSMDCELTTILVTFTLMTLILTSSFTHQSFHTLSTVHCEMNVWELLVFVDLWDWKKPLKTKHPVTLQCSRQTHVHYQQTKNTTYLRILCPKQYADFESSLLVQDKLATPTSHSAPKMDSTNGSSVTWRNAGVCGRSLDMQRTVVKKYRLTIGTTANVSIWHYAFISLRHW